MADVYVMIGIPGSGKSYFCTHHIKDNIDRVSRDAIRFSLLKDDEEYFSHESEVYKIMWDQINNILKQGKDVFVDQTSITKHSRKYLMSHLEGYDHINAVWIDTPIEKCLEQNKTRTSRAKVPDKVIHDMFSRFQEPTLDEGFYRIFKYKDGKMTMKEAK